MLPKFGRGRIPMKYLVNYLLPTRRELLGAGVLTASALAAPAFVSNAASAADEKRNGVSLVTISRIATAA
jgi:uncharacterized protein (DUF1501 family)